MSPVLDFAIINNEYLDGISLLYLFGITLFFTQFGFILPIFLVISSLKILVISGMHYHLILIVAKITNNQSNHIFNSQFLTQKIYLIVSFSILYLIYSFNKSVLCSYIFFCLVGIG